MNILKHTSLRSGSAVAILVAAALSGCGGGGGGGGSDGAVYFNASGVIANLADNVIVPTYQELDGKTADMQTAVAALDGDDLTDDELAQAQDAWKATRRPWEAAEGFLFGPVDSLGIDPKLDTWPLDTATLASTIGSGSGYNANASTDVQGFHTAEYLLFGDGTSSNDRTTDLSANERAYLTALLADFRTQTQKLVQAWTSQYVPGDTGTGPYADELKLQGDGIYSSQLAVMEELINGMIGIVDEVGNGKIADPFGTSIATADTTLVESQYSWNSLTDFYNNIQSVLNLYTGKRGYDPAVDSISTSLNGVYAFVNAHDAALADRVLDEIVAAMEAIALIDGDSDATTTDIDDPMSQMPFRNAIKDAAGRIRIQAAIDALATLQDSLEQDVQPLIARTNFGG